MPKTLLVVVQLCILMGCGAPPETWHMEDDIVLRLAASTDLVGWSDCPPNAMCCGEIMPLSVVLRDDGIFMTQPVFHGEAKIPKLGDNHDFESLRARIVEFKESRANSPVVIELMASENQSYEEILAALEACEAGAAGQLIYKGNRDIEPLTSTLVDGLEIFINDSEGAVEQGERTGAWVEYWYGEKVGEGEYVAGERHGPWSFWQLGELVAEGKYEHGVASGHWSVVRGAREFDMPPGVDSGELLEGRRHGRWITRSQDGAFVSHIDYAHGVRSGAYTTWFGDQKIHESQYSSGRRHGQSLSWYRTGARASSCNYERGKLEGRCREWHRGKVSFAQTLAGHRPTGHSSRARANAGELEYEMHYKDGIPHGVWREWHFSPLGRVLKKRTQYVLGKEHGASAEWHSNGVKAASGAYAHGEKAGLWSYWDAEGTELTEASEAERRFESRMAGQVRWF